jgi:hypothetical protein
VKPACETCRFWRVRVLGVHGLCHRHPPTFTGYRTNEYDGNSAHPPTTPFDWCGEYEEAAQAVK